MIITDVQAQRRGDSVIRDKLLTLYKPGLGSGGGVRV